VSQAPDVTLLDAIAAADRGLEPGAALTLAPAPDAAPRAASRYVLFGIASTQYAVPEAYVTELERVPRMTAVPRVPAWLRGVTNLRGDIVSVVDMRIYLGLSAYLPPTARLLVVRLLDEPFTTGLVVDAVDRIVTLRADDIAPPASPLEGPLTPFLTGVCTVGDRLVAVLDIDRLLRSPDIRQFEEPRSVDAAASAADSLRTPSW
jgi:purine-binding chemotaxis protein CheW